MMWDKKDDRKKRCRQHPVWGARCGSASNKMMWRLTCCGTVFLSSRYHSIILPLSLFICIMYFRAYLVIFKFLDFGASCSSSPISQSKVNYYKIWWLSFNLKASFTPGIIKTESLSSYSFPFSLVPSY